MTDIKNGLTGKEAEELKANGLVNGTIDVPTKSVGQIFRTNIFTFFNLINIVLAALVFSVGSYKNALFMGVVLCNTAIGIFQEIRAKKTIDRLSLLSAPKAHVIRDGVCSEISAAELLLSDITELDAGMQICADSVVREGECEVDESLITGESDPVPKKCGEELLSGSFIVSGKVRAEVIRVGKDNLAAKITAGAKYLKKNSSKMLGAVNAIIRTVAFIIIPVGIILFTKSLLSGSEEITGAVTSSVAAVLGMIPEGLVLLTSIVLAVSVIRLSKYNTLVQDMYAIETLARVDVLCLDKTGTITEGKMEVTEVIPLDGAADVHGIMTALMSSSRDSNPTFMAMRARWSSESDILAEKVIPFSSARKWSGAELSQPSGAINGTYIIGAAEFVFASVPKEISDISEKYASAGMRVLLLSRSDGRFNGNSLPDEIIPLAIIIIGDIIRKEAPDALRFFDRQGVAVKIISGDNPLTVSAVAGRAGLRNADSYIDLSSISDGEVEAAATKYTVFGRVTPDRKLALVKAFRKAGHTVGMTGDGVNDVLALKEADCSVAMQSGSDAAKNVSSFVLLDSNFASMPKVVAEGRRSINNVERSGSLFLTKTVYATILALVFVFVSKPYPFIPIQMTLISGLAIGLPSFLLALEPNFNLVRGRFISNVMKLALPMGLSGALSVLLCVLLSHFWGLSPEETRTVATVALGFTSMSVLFRLCLPIKAWRLGMIAVLTGVFAVGVLFFEQLFAITLWTPEMLLCAGISVATAILLVVLMPLLTRPLIDIISRFFGHKENKQ